MTIQELAQEWLDWFEVGKRDDGKTFFYPSKMELLRNSIKW